MTTKENHLLQQYEDVISDIMNNRSTSQMLRKYYLVDGQMEKVDEETILTLRSLVARKKAELRRKGLSGIDAQDIAAPASEEVGKIAYSNSSREIEPYSAPSYTDERPAPNYMQAPVSDMQAHIQNAELRSEIRFLKHQLSTTEKELSKLQNEGLGNTNLNTEHVFLKRDHSDLQKKHEETQKKLDKLEPEYETLKEDSKTWARLEKAATLLTSQPEMFISILSAINPVAGRNAASALAGLSGGDQKQLSSGESTQGASIIAMQVAQAIDQAFTQEEQRQLAQIINHCMSRKELVSELAFMLQRRLEELAAKAERIPAEGPAHAETI